MMLAQVVARARPWCNVGGGTVYDRRWMQPVQLEDTIEDLHGDVGTSVRKIRSMATVVREASQADYAAIAELTVDVYIGEEFSPRRAKDSLDDVSSRANSSEILVAVDNDSGEILGAVSLILADGPLTQLAQEEEGEIRLLAVRPRARGRGTGDALTRECIRRASEAGKRAIVLSTQPAMTAAQRLYERHGFRRDAALDWKTSDGRKMLGYRLELP